MGESREARLRSDSHGAFAGLRLSGVRKAFGATRALVDVSLDVEPGEVHALIGENGAGKSTLVKILSGAHRPDAGTMELAGGTYAPLDPHDARRRGIATIYQELSIAPHLSVRENILLGAEAARFGWISTGASRARARETLAQLGHADLPLEAPAGARTIAEQQVAEIARALLGRPRVLIMDEPTSSLAPADTEALFSVIGRLKIQGVSVIYISHFLEECRRVADRYTVLKDGEVAGSGAMAGASLDSIVALMTGRKIADLYPRASRMPGPPVLAVRSAARAPRLRRASLELRAGEIFGLAGLVGSGRTDLLRAVFALDRMDSGEVAIVKERRRPATPRNRWRQGLGFLSEDRKAEGLMHNLSVAENLTFPKLPEFSRFGWIDTARQAAAAGRWIADLRVKCRGGSQPVGDLSGGNQQKVALARLLEHPAQIFVLDEPTRGIDIGSKAEIYRILGDLAAQGKSVLLSSSYLPELLGLCDTIGVMCRGELVAVRPRSQWSEAEILRVATGGTP